MGRESKKVETTPTSTQNVKGDVAKGKDAEQEKKGRGHRQKGAGTVVVSKGEITVGGVVMKEWQRTPLQLVQEYCQKQKRPKPLFNSDRAPPGKFCVRVVLPDPKNREKDLMYSSKESFTDSVLARNCSCLLALKNLQPTLPLHQKLPEPYSSMWLKLTGMEDSAIRKSEEIVSFACPFCDKTFEKNMSLKVHLNKEHKGQTVDSSSSFPTTPIEQVADYSVESSLLPSDPIPQITPAPVIPTGNPVQRVSDYRNDEDLRELSLESRGTFSSRYDKQHAEEQRRLRHVQAEKRRDIQYQLRKPPTVMLSEEYQTYLLSLLRKTTDSPREDVVGKETTAQLREKLKELGFASAGITGAVAACGTLSACIDWCCLNLPDNQLPALFRAGGKQLEVKRNNGKDGDAVLVRLVRLGFSVDDVRTICKTEKGLIACMRRLTSSLLCTDFSDGVLSDEQREGVDEEEKTLLLIFNIDNCTPIITVETEGTIRFLQYHTTLQNAPAIITVMLGSVFSYPIRPPVAFLQSGVIPDVVRLAFTRAVFQRFSGDCEGKLYDVLSDVEALLQQARGLAAQIPHSLLTSSPSPSPSTLSPTSTHSLASRKTSSHHSVRSSRAPHRSPVNKIQLLGTPSISIKAQRAALPITTCKQTLLEILRHNQVCVVSGGTGCGKSTQVPQFIMEDFRDSHDQQQKYLNILVCEPRRLSCLGLYNRVLDEQGFTAGRQCPVAYQVRGDSNVGPSTVINYCTTGILLRQLQSESPTHITHIIVDEIHERSILSDFLLLLLKQLLPSNPSMKIILMSATLNQQLFSEYFGGIPILEVEGRLFPVKENYLEDIVFDTQYTPSSLTQQIDFSLPSSHSINILTSWCDRYQDYHLIPHLIQYLYRSSDQWIGTTILVFLSGAAEIKSVRNLLEAAFSSDPSVEILSCHGSLSTYEQKRVFDLSPNHRRIVLSTNIAETSLTIPSCVCVIDTGREKQVMFNPHSNITEMKEVWISRASAEQRKGRAGRVCSGTVYRLFTQAKLASFESYTAPEMLRSPLDALCLQTLRMNLGSPETVLASCITPPSADSIRSALLTLQEIQAVRTMTDSRGKTCIALTPLGNHIADLPVDSRLAKLLLYGCLLHCVDAVITMAAFLSQQSVYRAPLEKRDEMTARKRQFAHRLSDHLTLLKVYHAWKDSHNRRDFCRSNFINYESMMTIGTLRKQFLDELRNINFLPFDYHEGDLMWNANGNKENVLKGAITAGLYGNIVKIEKTKIKFHKTIEGGAFESTPEAKEYRLLIHRSVEGSESHDGCTRVFIHPSSINFMEREYAYPLMLYTTVMNTSKVYLHDLTVIPPYALLLFGGAVEIQHMDGTISVDGWLKFTAPARVGVLVQKLREYMDDLLREKFDDPEARMSDDPVLKEICALLVSNGL